MGAPVSIERAFPKSRPITLPIADCGFPIGFFRYGLIGNRQLQIGNRMTHRLPPGGNDFMGPFVESNCINTSPLSQVPIFRAGC